MSALGGKADMVLGTPPRRRSSAKTIWKRPPNLPISEKRLKSAGRKTVSTQFSKPKRVAHLADLLGELLLDVR